MECLRGGELKVAVKGLQILCKEKDLLFLPDGPQDEESLKKSKSKSKKGNPRVEAASIDLHGMRVEEAMKWVEERVNQALMEGADALRVVHGKGTGKIQASLHRYLRGLSVVKRFKIDENNAGVTWVYF